MSDNHYIELRHYHLESFNARSLPAVKDFLSPSRTADFRGKQKSESREEMLPNYMVHWA
jgi:hypothetical protein